jgi:hypothetical protein
MPVTPGIAVGFCFIPLFNFYWFFAAVVILMMSMSNLKDAAIRLLQTRGY